MSTAPPMFSQVEAITNDSTVVSGFW